jgi:PLP dependent protein
MADSFADAVDLFRERLANIYARIVTAGGSSETVRVVAVSKGHDAEAVRVALAAGHRDFGENYVDELLLKADQLRGTSGVPQAVWHFQGRLQRNKINKLTPCVSVWHTLDTPDRIRALATRAAGAAVFIQVNSAVVAEAAADTDADADVDADGTQSSSVKRGSGDRAGALLSDIPDLVELARRSGLDVRGLMTVAPLAPMADQPELQRVTQQRAFRAVASLGTQLGLPELSMGMSDDLEDAVAAGSTWVRVGSALFGSRSLG